MFTKTKFDTEQISELDLSSYGVSEKKVPKGKSWDFAISGDGTTYFTQLISSTNEMREGIYWYLYFSGEHYCLILIDNVWDREKNEGLNYCKARIIENKFFLNSGILEIKENINQAMIAIREGEHGLIFSN